MPKDENIKRVLVIGSGPIIIGQACEFDYSGTQACKALKEEGYEVVLVNSNPATIMIDPGMADLTYIEPLTVENVEEIIAKERPDFAAHSKRGILAKYGVKIIGVEADAIERVKTGLHPKKPWPNLVFQCPRARLLILSRKRRKLHRN